MKRRRAIVALLSMVTLVDGLSLAQSRRRTVKVTMVTSTYEGEVEEFRAYWLPLFKEHGFVEGVNLALTPVKQPHLSDIERERVARRVVESTPDVILVTGIPMTLIFQRLTRDIPIVFSVGDPIEVGLVKSLNRPGANLTGIANLSPDLNGKRLELLKELQPSVRRVAVLRPTPLEDKPLVAISSRLEIELVELAVTRTAPANEVAKILQDAHVEGAIFSVSYEADTEPQLQQQLLRLGLAAAFAYPDAVEQGGLISYGVNASDLDKRFIAIAARVLHGENPATIAVEQPSTFSFVINLRTASALGIKVPNSVRLRADRVVE